MHISIIFSNSFWVFVCKKCTLFIRILYVPSKPCLQCLFSCNILCLSLAGSARNTFCNKVVCFELETLNFVYDGHNNVIKGCWKKNNLSDSFRSDFQKLKKQGARRTAMDCAQWKYAERSIFNFIDCLNSKLTFQQISTEWLQNIPHKKVLILR